MQIEIRNNTRNVWEISYLLDELPGTFLIGGNDDGAAVRRLGKQSGDTERLGSKARVTPEVFAALLKVNGVKELFDAEDFEAPGHYIKGQA